MAWWGLRAYLASTVPLVVSGAVAVTAALTIVPIGKLALAPIPASDLGIGTSANSWSPNASRLAAIAALKHVLLGLAVAVLCVAVVTALTLAASRAAARREETTTRRSVGASRRQLRLTALLEGAALAALAVALGAPGGLAGAHWAIATWPGRVGPPAIGQALVCTIGLAAVVVSGAVLPALSLGRTLRVKTRSAIPHGFTAPVAQFGISLAILVAAAQLGRHAGRLMTGPQAVVRPTGLIYDIHSNLPPERRAAGYASLLHRLVDAGFSVVSLTSPGVPRGLGTVDPVITDCGKCFQGGLALPYHAVPVVLSAISPDTFKAMGVRVVRGRSLAASDRWEAPRVAVVNEALAALHYEGGVAVGRKILVGHGASLAWFTVVGVVENSAPSGLGAAFQPRYGVYVSALQLPPDAAEILVRPSPGAGLARRVEQAVQASLGASGGVVEQVAESEQREAEAAPVRWFGRLVRFEGAVALALSMAGMFAVMHLWVRALRPELGVRRAAGARRRRILGYMLARAALVAIIGVAAGLWVAQMTSGALALAVPGLPGRDPGVLLGPVLLLVAATLAGGLIPAWRAARASPAATMADL